jgi:hypothetical protein
MAPFEALYGR